MFRFFRRKPHTRSVIELWNSPRSKALDYYEKAESEEWLRHFWQDGSPFRGLFDRLDLSRVLDLACGQGRHTAKFIERAGHVTLFDTSAVAMDFCRRRFADRDNLTYIVSPTGTDLNPIADDSMTSVFSYDAMVHFEDRCVFGYLPEIARVLRAGGLALLHISAYDKHIGRDFRANPDWRAHMSLDQFRTGAAAAGLSIESLQTIPWSTAEHTDALVMLAKR